MAQRIKRCAHESSPKALSRRKAQRSFGWGKLPLGGAVGVFVLAASKPNRSRSLSRATPSHKRPSLKKNAPAKSQS